MTLPPTDANALAKRLQSSVPLVPEPFAAVAHEMGRSAESVLEQVREWSAEGKLREISGVLEGDALGYESALVAASVPEEDVERVAEGIAAHPTVTHDYLRDHELNLWFTLAVPAEMGLDATLAALARETGVADFHPFRRTAVYKIGVRFDLETRRNETDVAAPRSVVRLSPTPHEKLLFRALQRPLPASPRPFADVAAATGVDEGELLEFGRRHLGGALRRYVATFRHRKLGVSANGMVVWGADEEAADRVGPLLAAAPEVSHCYARNPVPAFPYRLYSMVHGPDEESCRRVAERLSGETGLREYRVLFSTREFKKTRLRYFLPELDAWWEAHGPVGSSRTEEACHEG